MTVPLLSSATQRWQPEVASLDFVVPPALEAHEPPEARGLARDEVRLMVSSAHDDRIVHTRFTSLPDALRPGDLVVVNASATIPAALPGTRQTGERVVLHFSQELGEGRWVLEVRRIEPVGTSPLLDAERGERITTPANATVTLVEPYHPRSRHRSATSTPRANATLTLHTGATRLWLARVDVPSVMAYLERHASPIRYAYVPAAWPLSDYQTIFAAVPGSAEMPSAGRAFTPRVVDALRDRGIVIAPIVLHAGVASLESHEPPYPERYRVSAATARAVNDARRRGGRIIAAGTTVVRALETVAEPNGKVVAREGWTDLVVTPERGLRVVDGLLTGFHEPRASHLMMIEALAGRRHLQATYGAALAEGYLWHEFGDLHLILTR